MSVRSRALLVGLITALLTGLAYLPLLRAGLLADDLGVLLQAAGETVPAPRGGPALEPAPLVRLSLSWSGATPELAPGEPGERLCGCGSKACCCSPPARWGWPSAPGGCSCPGPAASTRAPPAGARPCS